MSEYDSNYDKLNYNYESHDDIEINPNNANSGVNSEFNYNPKYSPNYSYNYENHDGINVNSNNVNYNVNSDFNYNPNYSYNKSNFNDIKDSSTKNEDNNKKANILCIISLSLGACSIILHKIDSINFPDILLQIMSIGSIVALIYVRVHYPKNIFGKILMWWCIIQWLIAVVIMIFGLISCLYCLTTFPA